MAETFHGPWRIVLTHVNSHFAQSVVVSRSDNADGRYDVAFGDALEILVQGSQWQLETQYYPFAGGAGWQPGDVRRATRFEPKHGMIVQLDGAARPPGSSGTAFNNLTLVCTCMDPQTNPIPADNPYDFTIPEH